MIKPSLPTLPTFPTYLTYFTYLTYLPNWFKTPGTAQDTELALKVSDGKRSLSIFNFHVHCRLRIKLVNGQTISDGLVHKKANSLKDLLKCD